MALRWVSHPAVFRVRVFRKSGVLTPKTSLSPLSVIYPAATGSALPSQSQPAPHPAKHSHSRPSQSHTRAPAPSTALAPPTARPAAPISPVCRAQHVPRELPSPGSRAAAATAIPKSSRENQTKPHATGKLKIVCAIFPAAPANQPPAAKSVRPLVVFAVAANRSVAEIHVLLLTRAPAATIPATGNASGFPNSPARRECAYQTPAASAPPTLPPPKVSMPARPPQNRQS
jgi:hypothetical protein